MSDRKRWLHELREALGSDGLLHDPASRLVYSRDASGLALGRPLAVCLPRDAAQVAAVVGICARHGVPFVARGAGTGLSGGALTPEGAVVISLARLDAIGPVRGDPPTATAGAGVPNARLRLPRPRGGGELVFAPDPSSQAAATVGGNVAENAGGPHCLKVGTTVHHVLGLDVVSPDGAAWRTGPGGFDLTALLVGSEGTLGVVTAAELALTPAPPSTETLLAYCDDLTDAARAVVALLGTGLLPAALEMVDREMLRVVEEAFAFGFRTDVAAALIVEFAGEPEETRDDARLAAARLGAAGLAVTAAEDDATREALWRCRKRAFGAVGRLAPAYISMDVVVPIGELPGMVADVAAVGRDHGVRIATALHAGDGNLHPGVMFDDRDPADAARARDAAEAILAAALARGGSATGEHGVGVEKLAAAARQLDPVALALMRGIRTLCDPAGICNPGKALPERADGAVPPVPRGFRIDAASLTATASADVDLETLQRAAFAHGLWIAVGKLPDGAAVGDLATRGEPTAVLFGTHRLRDLLLEVWGETGDGRRFHAGRPVAKNVVGYDLPRLVCGAGGALARIDAVTLQLRPVPHRAVAWDLGPAAAPADVPAGVVNLDGVTRLVWSGHRASQHPRLIDARLAEAGIPVRERRGLSFLEAWDALATWLPAAPAWNGLAAPADERARELARGLKRLFDPDGRLPTPRWLQEGSR